MANNENTASKATEKAKDNRVELFVPRGYNNEDPNEHIQINGVNYILPRGKKSLVPDFVAEEFYRSQRASEKRDQNATQMLEASK